MAQFRPADHSKGDANTIGGYIAVHDRPAAFEGADGFSYSVELLTDATGEAERPFAAYFLFVRWSRIGAQTPQGHLESEYLTFAASEDEALRMLGATRLDAVRSVLDDLIARARPEGGRQRRWWDAMNDEPESGP